MLQTIATIWLVSSVICTIWLAYELRRQPAIMKMMKVAWLLITLYLGVVGLWLYVASCREPEPGTHDAFVAPMWKQAVGSVMHCVAGDALGIVAAATVTSWLSLPMAQDMVVEYIAGFLVGWLLFQTIPMMRMNGTTFTQELRSAFVAEFLSLTFMVMGMFPTMAYLMTMWNVMSPADPTFWFVMSTSILVGSLVTYPINWWMVRRGMKHGMGGSHVLGQGGTQDHAHHPSDNGHVGHHQEGLPEHSVHAAHVERVKKLGSRRGHHH
ncbi:MAG: DUF4396 domain-containing protein [Bacilli bacterium]